MLRISLLILFMLAASGCSFLKKDEPEKSEYAPAEPVVIKRPRDDSGSIYQGHMQAGLFDDLNARNIGDIITIKIVENTNAASTANTNATKDNKVDLPSPKLAGDTPTRNGKEILDNEINGEREFNGQGSSQQNSNMSGTITVTVAKVLPNRNLVIKGEKLITLNQAEEFIRISGIVRPQDIEPDNTVISTRVANVNIMYAGTGTITDANRMGLLGRFFQGKAWPY